MWLATLESPNFSFEAAGATETEARNAMVEGLGRHHKTLNADDAWLRDAIADIEVRHLQPGRCYRDGTEI